MPAPRSRRPARASQRQQAPDPAPEEDDVEVVEPVDEYAAQTLAADEGGAPAEGEGEGAAQTGRSSRRGRGPAGKSNRMSASERRASARKSMKTSSRRVALSPEELAKRRAARMLAIKTILGVILGCGGAFAIWWFGLRTSPKVDLAQQKITAAKQAMSAAETAISIRNAKEAEVQRGDALKLLEIKELNFAKENPDPEDPELASIELANAAAALAARIEGELKKKVEKLEQDLEVEANLRRVQAGFGRLAGENAFDDAELATFERQVQEFLDNPVLPGAGANPAYQEAYVTEIKQIRYEVAKIEREKARRNAEITNIPVREARLKAAILVQQSRFQEALVTVDEMQRTYENADFAGVRQYIRDAAEMAWKSSDATAKEHYTTYQAPGTTKSLAEASLKAAREVMQHVVDNYGIPEYVQKAETALKMYR